MLRREWTILVSDRLGAADVPFEPWFIARLNGVIDLCALDESSGARCRRLRVDLII